MARLGTTGLVLISVLIAVSKVGHAQQQNFRDVDDLCLQCICQASTGCQNKQCANLGGTTFCGPYQISQAYWQDAGQPVANQGTGQSASQAFEECATDMTCSENTVRRYLVKYARNCNKDSLLDCEDIARLHKAGPFACDQPALESTPYWTGFQDCWYGKRK